MNNRLAFKIALEAVIATIFVMIAFASTSALIQITAPIAAAITFAYVIMLVVEGKNGKNA